MRSATSPPLRPLFLDRFLTTRAAGGVLTTPAEPGLATLRGGSDSGNNLEAASGNLQYNGRVSDTDPRCSYTLPGGATGQALIMSVDPANAVSFLPRTSGGQGIDVGTSLARLVGTQALPSIAAVWTGSFKTLTTVWGATRVFGFLDGMLVGVTASTAAGFTGLNLDAGNPGAVVPKIAYVLVPRRPIQVVHDLHDTFTADDGTLLHGHVSDGDPEGWGTGIATWRAPSGWSVSGNTVVNVLPAEDLSSLAITDWDAELVGVANWGVWYTTLAKVADERPGGVGTQSVEATSTASPSYATRTLSPTAGQWGRISVWVNNATYTSTFLTTTQTGAIGSSDATGWRRISAIYLGGGVAFTISIGGACSGAGKTFRVDDLAYDYIRRSSLFATSLQTTPDVVMQATIANLVAGTQAGLVCCRDTDGMALVNNAGGYAAGSTEIALDTLCKAVAAADSVKIGTTWYTLAGVGAYVGGAQTITLAAGLGADVANDASVQIDDVACNAMLATDDGTNLVVRSFVNGTPAVVSTTARTWAAGDLLTLRFNGTSVAVWWTPAATGIPVRVGGDNAVPEAIREFPYAGLFDANAAPDPTTANKITELSIIPYGTEGQHLARINHEIAIAGAV